jgi:pSer/pThr/pTyr-binding forkhead associated (FHA) protein
VAERRIPLTGDEVRIGRRSSKSPHQPEIDLTGPPLDPGVSRRHAELRRLPDGGWSVIDLGSPNGIQVNGKDVPSGTVIPVNLGDQIHLGAWTLITLTIAAP